MASKGSFENSFDDYSTEAAIHVLNSTKDGISTKFQNKLQGFVTSKLLHLTTTMQSDIFYDGTVYTGSCGLALYYLMSFFNKNEASHETLKLALKYLNINQLKGRRISFLCGDAGPLALATVISFKLGPRNGNLPDYKSLTQRLISLISLLNDSPDELLYGKAGYLYALLFVNKYLPEKETIPANLIERVAISILRSGKQYSMQMRSESPLLWNWHEKIYLGAAHGMAGILYMLLQIVPLIESRTQPSSGQPTNLRRMLQARAYISVVDLRSFIKPAIDWLITQKYPSGNFPSSYGSGSGDRLVQWCHGAPGFVPLFILSHKVFEDDKYLKIALKCGDVIWERGLCTKGYSICHGVSGNAYAFIQLYQATKIPLYLYRACCFMEWCAVEQIGSELHVPDRPASLFEGLVGRLYLAEDLQRVMDAKFPAFDL